MRIEYKDLITTIGGASSFSGTFINSITKAISFIFVLGQTFGSAIRYKKSNMTC